MCKKSPGTKCFLISGGGHFKHACLAGFPASRAAAVSPHERVLQRKAERRRPRPGDPPTAGANIMVLARDIDRNRGPVLLRCVLPPE